MCLSLHSLSPSSAPLPHCFPTLGWIIQGFPVCPRSPYPVQKWLFSRQPHRAVHEEGSVSEGSSFPDCLPSFPFWATFPFSHSLTLAPMIVLPLPPCPWCPQLLLAPILYFFSLPWLLCCLPVPCRWALPPALRPPLWAPCPSLLHNNMRITGTITAFVGVDEHTEDLVG